MSPSISVIGATQHFLLSCDSTEGWRLVSKEQRSSFIFTLLLWRTWWLAAQVSSLQPLMHSPHPRPRPLPRSVVSCPDITGSSIPVCCSRSPTVPFQLFNLLIFFFGGWVPRYLIQCVWGGVGGNWCIFTNAPPPDTQSKLKSKEPTQL